MTIVVWFAFAPVPRTLPSRSPVLHLLADFQYLPPERVAFLEPLLRGLGRPLREGPGFIDLVLLLQCQDQVVTRIQGVAIPEGEGLLLRRHLRALDRLALGVFAQFIEIIRQGGPGEA